MIHVHIRNELRQACKLLASVKSIVAIPLIDHIVMLGIQPACHQRMFSKLIHHDVVVPAPIHISGTAFITPHISTFAVEHGNFGLLIASNEVPF